MWHFSSAQTGVVSVTINGKLAINSSLAVHQAALEGLGIVQLNSYIVGDDIQRGRLIHLLKKHKPEQLGIYAVLPQRRYMPVKVKLFIEAMLDRMGPSPPWDSFLSERSSVRARPRH